MFKTVPTGFIPTQDTGYLFVSMQLPDATAGTHTRKAVDNGREIISKVEGVQDVTTLAGISGASFSRLCNAGAMFIKLKPKEERLAMGKTLNDIILETNSKLSKGVLESASVVLPPPCR